ncbi:MAG TPA: hypothetical protein PLE61_13410 [Vicinamibacterales bacterium]|nr:hypothetical protein [Vicinamibacterales bacterium]HPW21798.1 hypothetical protein [Vicinamibacterales bacterium]
MRPPLSSGTRTYIAVQKIAVQTRHGTPTRRKRRPTNRPNVRPGSPSLDRATTKKLIMTKIGSEQARARMSSSTGGLQAWPLVW